MPNSAETITWMVPKWIGSPFHKPLMIIFPIANSLGK